MTKADRDFLNSQLANALDRVRKHYILTSDDAHALQEAVAALREAESPSPSVHEAWCCWHHVYDADGGGDCLSSEDLRRLNNPTEAREPDEAEAGKLKLSFDDRALNQSSNSGTES